MTEDWEFVTHTSENEERSVRVKEETKSDAEKAQLLLGNA